MANKRRRAYNEVENNDLTTRSTDHLCSSPTQQCPRESTTEVRKECVIVEVVVDGGGGDLMKQNNKCCEINTEQQQPSPVSVFDVDDASCSLSPVYNRFSYPSDGASGRMKNKRQKVTKKVENSGEFIDSYSPQLFLSDDLVSEILIRLPTRPLFRFKCVSKGWRSLISHPSFVKRLKSHPPLTEGYFYYDEKEEKVNYLCGGFNNEINSNLNSAIEDTHLSFLPCSTVVVSSHSGLLLCTKKPKRRYLCRGPVQYFVCNPFTKQFMALPQLYADENVDALLFCYDEEEDSNGQQQLKFKVVCVGWKEYVVKVDTYSSEMKEWEQSTIFHEYEYRSPRAYSAIYSEGVVYVKSDAAEYGIMCVYDMKEKSVCFIRLPSAKGYPRYNERLVVSAGESVYLGQGRKTHFNVWILVDRRKWVLKHRIAYQTLRLEMPETSGTDSMWSCVCRLVDHELILVTLRLQGCYKRFLYRIKTKRLEPIRNFQHNPCFPVITYSLPAWGSCLRSSL